MSKRNPCPLGHGLCSECKIHHNRDVNASINLKKEGIRLLKEKDIAIISNSDNTIGTMGIHAFGDRVRPYSVKATVNELGIYSLKAMVVQYFAFYSIFTHEPIKNNLNHLVIILINIFYNLCKRS